MKKTNLIFLLFLMVSAVYAQNISHQDISRAVLNTLPKWLSVIPAGDETNYGFQNREEFSRAGLGTPIEEFAMGNDFNTQKGQAARMLPLGQWRIPVIVDQKNRAMVTVIKENSEWKIVDFGAAGLASELNDFENQLTAEQFQRLKMVRVYQPLTDFLFYDDPESNPDQIVLLPLLSASKYLESQGLQTKKTWTLEEVVKVLHKSVSNQNQK
jgi:hypothetical protein